MGNSAQAAASSSQTRPDPLIDRLRAALSGRVVIAGIGNRVRGDDALGPAVVDRLQGRVEAALVDCGEVPERYLGAITERAPQSVVLIDAVDLEAAPGSVAMLAEGELPDRLGTTHNTPLRVLMHYLAAETGARITLLAVQPAQLESDSPMSPQVEATVGALADVIAIVLSEVKAVSPEDGAEMVGCAEHDNHMMAGTPPKRSCPPRGGRR